MVRIPIFLFLLFACLFMLENLSAQDPKCDAVRPLPGSRSSYQKRENRCEGLYVADVGSRSIDVVSFTAGNLAYDLNTNLPLQVAVSSQAPMVHIRGVAIPPKTYYRMDAVLRNGAVLVWPVADVLKPENLTDSRIGILGWTGTEDSKTFVPVAVSTGKPPSTAAKPTPILLSIQASFDVETVKWRSARTQGTDCLAFDQWRDAVTRIVIAGKPIQIDLQQLPGRLNCVEFAARSRDSNDWVTQKIRIEMPAR